MKKAKVVIVLAVAGVLLSVAAVSLWSKAQVRRDLTQAKGTVVPTDEPTVRIADPEGQTLAIAVPHPSLATSGLQPPAARDDDEAEYAAWRAAHLTHTPPVEVQEIVNLLAARQDSYGSFLMMAVEIQMQMEPAPTSGGPIWRQGPPVWKSLARQADACRSDEIRFVGTDGVADTTSTVAVASIIYKDAALSKSWSGQNNSASLYPMGARGGAWPSSLCLSEFMLQWGMQGFGSYLSDSSSSGQVVRIAEGTYRGHVAVRVDGPDSYDPTIGRTFYFAKDLDYYPLRWEKVGDVEGGNRAAYVRYETLEYERQGNVVIPKLAVRYNNRRDGRWHTLTYFRFFFFENNPFSKTENIAPVIPPGARIHDNVIGAVLEVASAFPSGTSPSIATVGADDSPTMFVRYGFTVERLLTVYEEAKTLIPLVPDLSDVD